MKNKDDKKKEFDELKRAINENKNIFVTGYEKLRVSQDFALRKTIREAWCTSGSIPMEDVSRAYEKGETLGLMKLVVDGDTREILGAAFLGTGGDEAVQMNHALADRYLKADRLPFGVAHVAQDAVYRL